MKWSYEWLKEYLDTDLTPEQIADKLNAIGLEVEDLSLPILPIAAKIVECAQHPDSDHLHVLKVDDGSGKLRQVVCGAPNARVGLVSALALPGCKIGDFVKECIPFMIALLITLLLITYIPWFTLVVPNAIYGVAA